MINKNKYKPIILVPSVSLKNKIRFLAPDKQFDISGDIVDKLWEIFSLFNGFNTINEIANILSVDADYIKKIVQQLGKIGVVGDATQQYRNFHNISKNPQVYTSMLGPTELEEHKMNYKSTFKHGDVIKAKINTESALYKMQTDRKTCRSFSLKKKLSKEQILNICNYAYSMKRHATPSGGGVFPLKLFCIIRDNQMDIKAGYYEYDALQDYLICYKSYMDIEKLKYCYNDSTLAYNSPLQIVICADLDRQGIKYSNLGYRLTLIEVGQVAQNISLYCAEQGLGSCEIGGILDDALADEIEIKEENLSPILAIAVGYEAEQPLPDEYSVFKKLIHYYVEQDKIVHNYGVHSFGSEHPFFGAWARFGINEKHMSGATGVSYISAVNKAIIEAYERYRSSCIRVDYIGAGESQNSFISPDDIAPLSQEQRLNMNLVHYNKLSKIEWTKDITGKYYLPSDFVFYGHNKKNKLFHSTSSGVAAHTDYNKAKENALVELVERDAVMRTWYTKKSPRHVAYDSCTKHIQNRIRYWESHNRKMYILLLDSQYVPVYMVVIISNEYPCFVVGAASSLNSSDEAMHKALQEAEYSLLFNLKYPSKHCPKLEEIRHPIDHGRFYHFYENAKRLRWLWSGKEKVENSSYLPIEFDVLCSSVDAIFIDLSENRDSYIKVIRAVSKRLVPINFGYKTDYYMHSELKKMKVGPESMELPHFFA